MARSDACRAVPGSATGRSGRPCCRCTAAFRGARQRPIRASTGVAGGCSSVGRAARRCPVLGRRGIVGWIPARICLEFPRIRRESAPNPPRTPPRTPRQRRLPAMRAPFERRSVRGDSVVRLGIRARPFEPPTHRPASDDPARSPPSQARSGVPAAPARLAESTRDLTVRCPFGTRALPRLPRSPAAGAVRETCLIIRHSRYSWIPRNSPFQLIERFSS
ncbi:hypothetical protein BTL_91 [Burkholderia thailandensis H0587]|nr:hypothetical protein BTL_91 [Burkholderia thailandensis H0587]